jgi:drug/metabolite transporter (DMT)-like permease
MFLCSGLVGAAVTAIVPISGDLRAELPFLLVSWPSLTMVLLVTFLGLSCLNIAGNICISRAYQTADSSRLAPLDFTYLLFVALWGRLFFDEWPTPLAGVGMAMIAVAGIITAMREQRQQRLRKMAGTPA